MRPRPRLPRPGCARRRAVGAIAAAALLGAPGCIGRAIGFGPPAHDGGGGAAGATDGGSFWPDPPPPPETDGGAPAPADIDPEWPPDEPLPAAFDFPPWLNLPEPGRLVVSWRTVEESTGRVRFGTSPDGGSEILSATAATLHHVDLGALPAGTAYWYEVEIDGAGAVRRGVFVTPGRASLRFAHLAEFHAPGQSDEVSTFAEEMRAFRPHLVVESGDMVDDGDVLEHWRSYFRTSAPWISNVILLPAGSNHVDGAGGSGLLLYWFDLPNNERWYTTRYGPVQFFTLDSTYSSTNPDIANDQPAWLGSETALARDGLDDPTFVVGAWHYPACSSHYASRASARAWVMEHFIGPMQASGGVDLVLVGHDKYYERSTIDTGTGGPIVHVMANVGALSPSTEGDNRAECTPATTRTDVRSLTLVSVDGARLEGRVVGPEGAEIDAFVIER